MSESYGSKIVNMYISNVCVLKHFKTFNIRAQMIYNSCLYYKKWSYHRSSTHTMRFGSCHGNYIFFLLKRRINSYAHSLQFIKLVIYSGFKDSVPIHSFLKFKLEYTHFYSFESVKQNKELFVSYLLRFFWLFPSQALEGEKRYISKLYSGTWKLRTCFSKRLFMRYVRLLKSSC